MATPLILGSSVLVGKYFFSDYITHNMSELYNFINSSGYKEELEQIYIELDYEIQLKYIKALLEDINKSSSKIIQMTIENIETIIIKIKKELKKIDKELEKHKTRYFFTWRKPNYYDNIENLRNFKKEIIKHTDYLIKILVVDQTVRLNNYEKNILLC